MKNVNWMAGLLLAGWLTACSTDGGREPMAPQLDLGDPAAGTSASGHGNWFNALGEHVSRSFHGRVMPDGSVKGEFVQHVTALDGVRRKNQSEVDCIHLLGPNDAMLSGVVKENVNPALIGQIQIFRVIDDGEGTDAVDRQSALVFRAAGLELNCGNFPPPAATPIVGGNIQVRP